MKETIPQIRSWITGREPFVLATVVQTWGSAPRKVGAHMAIHASGTMAGSVSGGCVESDVVKHAMELLESGHSKMLNYQVSDEDAWDVGLSCGGSVQVFCQPFFISDQSGDASFWKDVMLCIDENKGGVIAHSLASGDARPQYVHIGDNSDLSALAWEAFSKRKHTIIQQGEESMLLEVLPRNSALIIVGAAHVTVDLVHFAQQMGFETVVIDPRGFFSEGTKFLTPPDQLLTAWPEEVLPDMVLDAFTYAVTLSHQPRIDDQALQILLRSDVAYIGALGSRKNHAKRTARLIEAGFSEKDVSRIHAPVGLDIHASSAREIALSIVAEIVQVKNQFL